MVEVTGLEPAASWSQTTRATNCATPRSYNLPIIIHEGCRRQAPKRKTRQPLEFYNRDKGRKALNLTEKYKNKSAGNEEKQAQRKESKKMLYQVIGVERKTGDFTPRDGSNRQIHYDNLVLNSVTLKRLVGCAGQKAEQCSIKVVDSADLLESVGAMDDFSKVIGHQFDFETSYGKIKSWELVK